MGSLTKEQAVAMANEAFSRYYNGKIDVSECYGIVLDREVRSKLNGWRAPDPWDVLGRPMKSRSRGERTAIRREKAKVRRPFVILRKI